MFFDNKVLLLDLAAPGVFTANKNIKFLTALTQISLKKSQIILNSLFSQSYFKIFCHIQVPGIYYTGRVRDDFFFCKATIVFFSLNI